MGRAIVPRLLAAGFPVTVWNRTPSKATHAVTEGAVLAASLPTVTRESDIVLTMLTDDAVVEAVYSGADGLLSRNADGRLFVELSTIRPDTIRRLSDSVRNRGATLVDAPVSGTVGPAREGKLMVLAGGSTEDVGRAEPVLKAFARRVQHLGPCGSGATMKLVLNMPLDVYWQALAEALAMGTRAGLKLDQMLDVILDSSAAIGVLAARRPAITGSIEEVPFDIAGVKKDLLAMGVTAHLLGVPTPSAAAALAGFAAATAAGWGDRDVAALVAFYIDFVQRMLQSPNHAN
jgi:3-hydroxyisobutyrate dehydrogenase-like beta-hydroxyacid dehydrogenase